MGDIDIELWSKEAPKACRNFVQLCMEGYYEDTVFHRIIKDFIAQGGDPSGTGDGGESIYGHPFKVKLFYIHLKSDVIHLQAVLHIEYSLDYYGLYIVQIIDALMF